MSSDLPNRPLPLAAQREFRKASEADWQNGVPLPDLLLRVNRVAACFASNDPEEPAEGRVSRVFTDRSFRHYQTLGCIDAPEKHGRLARYGYRHFLQALLVRQLLWQRLSSDQIAALLVGRPTAELERMLLEGVELVPRAGLDAGQTGTPVLGSLEPWSRVRVAPGVELHLHSERPRLKAEDLRQLIEQLELVLRRHRSP